MKSRMRFGLAAAPILIVSAAALRLAAAIASPALPLAPHPADLTVHEWGTFTSVAGDDGAAIEWDALGCKDDLPTFVNDFGYRGLKWRLRGTVRMETPVLYFYSPRDVDASVSVTFPKGLITEWYPQANYTASQADGRGHTRPIDSHLFGIDTALQTVTGTIEWPHVTVQPGTTPVLPIENGSSRYYAARDTDAAPLSVLGQFEKFLFYRGVGRFPIPLSVRSEADGRIVVENSGRGVVPGVILFENRGGRLGYRNLGAIESATTVASPVLDEDTLPQLRYDLENILLEQGLYLKEAQAMVATWHDSWFEEGARLIYVMPASTVDAILPLHVAPSPSRTVRVFVGRIELLTPGTLDTVERALVEQDSAALDRYRRFLEPILKRVIARSPATAFQAQRALEHTGC
jgi:hypothetical protein